MKIKNIVATAALTISAMAITGGTSYAAPIADPAAAQPIDAPVSASGIGYQVVRSDADKSVTATLTGGTFQLTDDAVNIVDTTGSVVSSMPLALTTEGSNLVVSMNPSIGADGTTLVAHPLAQDIGQWLPSSPQIRSAQAGMGLGALGGMAAGLILGVVIAVATGGIGIIALPFTTLIGALIGTAVGAATGSAANSDNRQDGWQWQGNCYTDPYVGGRYCD